MIDVGDKPVSKRRAVAVAHVTIGDKVRDRIVAGSLPKGDVLAVARVAGIMAAKQTSALIPLCHPLPISGVSVEFELDEGGAVRIGATVRVSGKTGVEMEALTAVSVAALTIYDMCKAVDKAMTIERIRLVHKVGGRSGEFRRADEA